MDHEALAAELQDATPFDLYRLYLELERELDNPERTEEARALLRPGLQVRFLDSGTLDLVPATVVEVRRTRVLVHNHLDDRHWLIRFCAVDPGSLDGQPGPGPEHARLRPRDLRVGDVVGFRDRQNRDVHGRVLSLNQKTATILTANGQRWRVAYAYLFPVLDMGSPPA